MGLSRAEYSVTISPELRALRIGTRASRSNTPEEYARGRYPSIARAGEAPKQGLEAEDAVSSNVQQGEYLSLSLFKGEELAAWNAMKLRRDGRKALRFRGLNLVNVAREASIATGSDIIFVRQKFALHVCDHGGFVFEATLAVEGSRASRPIFRSEEVQTVDEISTLVRSFNPVRVFMLPPVVNKTEDVIHARLLQFHETVLTEFFALLAGSRDDC